MNSVAAEPFLNQMGTQEHHSYPSNDPRGQLVVSPPTVTVEPAKENAAMVFLSGKGSHGIQPFKGECHVPENAKQSRSGRLDNCKQWFSNHKCIAVLIVTCICIFLHFVWLLMVILAVVDIFGHHYTTNNITFYNMQGNLTPFLNASQIDGEVQSGTIHRLYVRDEGKYIPYKVASGPCKPNKQGHFEFKTVNINVGEDFLTMFDREFLNSGASLSISFQSDLSAGRYMTAYLVRHSCFLVLLECISSGNYAQELSVTNINKAFTITIPKDGYYYLFVKSGISGEYIMTSWEVTCDYHYYTYEEPAFTYICHVPDVEDGPPCSFKINNTQCYFLETKSYEYFSPRIYEYRLDYTTNQKHKIKDDLHYTVLGAIIFLASFVLSVILIRVIYVRRKKKHYNVLP